MKKRFLRLLIGGMVLMPVMLSCASLGFYDREISMKESCVLVFQGSNTIDLIINDERRGDYINVNASAKERKTLIIPAGTYTFAWGRSYREAIDTQNRTAQREGRSYWYTWKTETAHSESTTLESGKRYKAERVGKTITITEMENGGISRGGVTTAVKSSFVANTLGWRSNMGFLFGEFGPQIGLTIASDPVVMNITGEATIGMTGWRILGGDYDGFGFPYRAGGSIATFFGKSRFGLSLGGGIIGQTIVLLGDEGSDMFPKIQVPYIQAKGLFLPDKNEYKAFGLFVDYYPTVTSGNFGTFGIGLTINY